MNTFIELRQEDDYQEIFHEGTGLISQVFDIFKFVLGFDIFPGRDLVQVPPSSSEGHDVPKRGLALRQGHRGDRHGPDRHDVGEEV